MPAQTRWSARFPSDFVGRVAVPARKNNVIPETIKGLEALGLMEVRVGLGVFVKAASLYEIRQRLELSYAREAVRQITDERLDEMQQHLDEMERLHRALFGGVANATLIKLFNIFRAFSIYP